MNRIFNITLLLIKFGSVNAQSLSDIQPLWTGSFGTATIDGEVYNQISLRPEYNLGKWGIGFDFYLYIDGEGNIYEDSWDFSDAQSAYRTIIDKIKYVRYGYPGDDVYCKVGTLSNISLGHGILINKYSNMMRYPQERKVGFHLKAFLPSDIGAEFILSDFKQSPSLIGARINYPLMSDLDLGVSFVSDPNLNSGLTDTDGDETPDFLDDFPNDSNEQVDTDGDGIADGEDFDIDGDGFDWWDHVDPEYWDALDDIFDDDFALDPNDSIDNRKETITFDDLKESMNGISVDLTYHINQNFKLYSEFGKLISSVNHKDPNGKTFSPGYGLIPLGLRAHYGPITFNLEYRQNDRYFIYHFWDRAYDINRSTVSSDSVITKANQLYQYGSLKGVYLNVSGNILNTVSLGMSFQDLKGEIWNHTSNEWFDDDNRTLLATISLNTSFIPKIRYLNAFYQKSNFSELSFSDHDINTIYGYNLGVDFSESMVLVYKSRTSFEPDGQGGVEPVHSMFIETQILF